MLYLTLFEDWIDGKLTKLRRRYLPWTIGIEKYDVTEKIAVFSAISVMLAILVGLIYLIFPKAIPFAFLEFWRVDHLNVRVLANAWPLFAWGIGITALVSFTTRNNRIENRHAELLLTGGFKVSACAGFFEEIVFRWLLFYIAIPLVLVLNAVTFGLWQAAYEYGFGPIANFFTLYKLDHILFNGYGWAVGSAVIFSNSRFRNGHRYQGIVGVINSWFCGMYFFLLAFDHGLPVAIMVHFLYNMFIYCVRYIDAAHERARGF